MLCPVVPYIGSGIVTARTRAWVCTLNPVGLLVDKQAVSIAGQMLSDSTSFKAAT